MKKTIKVILSSAVSMAVCASLIAGSTFALFTGGSDVNIAITSGKIDVTASAEIQKVWSAEWNGSEYTDVDIEDDNGDGTYIFTNEGTASYEGGTLSLNNITPGDGVEFKVTVNNESTISVRYQMRIALKDTVLGENGEKLSDRLQADIVDETVAGKYGAITGEWSDPIDEGATIEPFTVKVYLPIDTEDAYQQLASELTLGVYAVQGNAGDSTPLADVIVNSAEGLSEALTDFAESTETDIVLGLMGNTAITDAAPIAIPENKDVTLDVNGNTVDVSKTTHDGESLTVPEGSTFTITDSSKSAEDEGSFNLTAKVDAENWSSGPRGTYTLRVEEGGTLNFEDVHCTLQNEDTISANHIVYVGGGTVNCNAGTEIDFTGSGFANGFLVREGGTMNVTDTTFQSSGAVGQITVGYLSYAEEESTVNINEGTEIKYENANSMAGAIVVYQTGNVNIHDGASITVCGEIPQEWDSEGNQYVNSAAAAIRVVGGGNVVMDGGTINLETTTTNGWAYAVIVLGNGFADPTIIEGYTAGQEVNAHIEFKGNAKILANEHAYIFAAQKNYKWIFGLGSDGIPSPNAGGGKIDFIKDESGNLVPTIIVQNGVTITAQGEVVKKGDTVFAQDEGAAYENSFGRYTPKAIEDQRIFE